LECGWKKIAVSPSLKHNLHESHMRAPEPILTAHLFPDLRRELVDLLQGLNEDEWQRPTAAKKWNVKDVAAHLLGGDVGNLSRRRDKHAPGGREIASWQELVGFINELNETWVTAARRLSPQVLCDLLAHTGPQIEMYFASLDPFEKGTPVSWAGPEPAPLWLDIAREYTERWHHQQQIRDGTARPGLYAPRLFAPVLDTFVRALPHTFRDVAAAQGACVQLSLSGAAGGDWIVRRAATAWELLVGQSSSAGALVRLEAEDAWKIFTRGIRGEEARRRAAMEGDLELGAKVLEMVSVIA
jgi:uncharacterized protein (TIGR03083 family)